MDEFRRNTRFINSSGSFFIKAALIISMFPIAVQALNIPPDSCRGIYLPPTRITQKDIKEFSHYAGYAGINSVVLHMKDPKGHIYWSTANRTANRIKAVYGNHNLKKIIAYFRSLKIRTIAKIDVFIDKQLASQIPALAVKNAETHELWEDFSGLNWVSPYAYDVWKYNIALCRELAAAGFDEIQFDYVRFPSDGDLSTISYPMNTSGISMADCISMFLKTAYHELKPLGVDVSADVFGLTAWKKDDFGVGQVLELITPYVDIICPMFYPSHFPEGFMGYIKPGDHPAIIMHKSIEMMKKRTDTKIRPWIQGFWYPPAQIRQQINAVYNAGIGDWMIWNSSGDYETSYRAIMKNLYDTVPPPQFYPGIDELRKNKPLIVRGRKRIINRTDYREGFSVLSLEISEEGRGFFTPVSVVYTMDEAILDIILEKNGVDFNKKKDKYRKSLMVSYLLCHHINRLPTSVRPGSIYIDWGKSARFTLYPPKKILNPQ